MAILLSSKVEGGRRGRKHGGCSAALEDVSRAGPGAGRGGTPAGPGPRGRPQARCGPRATPDKAVGWLQPVRATAGGGAALRSPPPSRKNSGKDTQNPDRAPRPRGRAWPQSTPKEQEEEEAVDGPAGRSVGRASAGTLSCRSGSLSLGLWQNTADPRRRWRARFHGSVSRKGVWVPTAALRSPSLGRTGGPQGGLGAAGDEDRRRRLGGCRGGSGSPRGEGRRAVRWGMGAKRERMGPDGRGGWMAKPSTAHGGGEPRRRLRVRTASAFRRHLRTGSARGGELGV